MKNLDAEELLTQAWELLMKDILAEVPDSLKYEVRMIANAIGISIREIVHQPKTYEAEFHQLHKLLADQDLSGQSVFKMREVLAARIRNGRFDEPEGRWDLLIQKLKTINNKHLAITAPHILSRSRSVKTNGADS